MTAYFPLTPSSVQAPSFFPTFDGVQYRCVVTWNLFGQRYYVNCYDLTGNLVFCIALIETPPGIQLSGLSWDILAQTVTATTLTPHGMPIGASINLTIEGVIPTTFGGTYLTMITGPSTFTYPMASDPGIATAVGRASALISMTQGYFASTLIYRNSQFEVSP